MLSIDCNCNFQFSLSISTLRYILSSNKHLLTCIDGARIQTEMKTGRKCSKMTEKGDLLHSQGSMCSKITSRLHVCDASLLSSFWSLEWENPWWTLRFWCQGPKNKMAAKMEAEIEMLVKRHKTSREKFTKLKSKVFLHMTVKFGSWRNGPKGCWELRRWISGGGGCRNF